MLHEGKKTNSAFCVKYIIQILDYNLIGLRIKATSQNIWYPVHRYSSHKCKYSCVHSFGFKIEIVFFYFQCARGRWSMGIHSPQSSSTSSSTLCNLQSLTKPIHVTKEKNTNNKPDKICFTLNFWRIHWI